MSVRPADTIPLSSTSTELVITQIAENPPLRMLLSRNVAIFDLTDVIFLPRLCLTYL
jgi:hypothetical protein